MYLKSDIWEILKAVKSNIVIDDNVSIFSTQFGLTTAEILYFLMLTKERLGLTIDDDFVEYLNEHSSISEISDYIINEQ